MKKIFLSISLIICLVFQVFPAKVLAAETIVPILSYLTDEERRITYGENYFDASSQLNQIKDLDSMTFTTKFQLLSDTGIQSLFFVGSNESGTENKYFTLYVYPKKSNQTQIGIEVRNGGSSPQINNTIDKTLNDNKWHTISMVFERNNYYKVYLDGEQIINHTNSSDTALFLNNLGLNPPTIMTFGKALRIGNANNYPFTGKLSNIQIFNSALPEKEILKQHGFIEALEKGPVFQKDNIELSGNNDSIDFSDKIDIIKNLSKGSIYTRFKIGDLNPQKDNGLMTIFSISNKKVANTYGVFYINAKTGATGYEIKNNNTMINSSSTSKGDIANDNWHSISYVFDKEKDIQKIYIDSVLYQESAKGSFLSDMTDSPDTLRIGDLSRSGKGDHTWVFKGFIDTFQIYDEPLTQTDIDTLHAPTRYETSKIPLPDSAIKTDAIDVFYSGYDNSKYYRIPSLLTVDDNIVIAAIDKRQTTDSDYGNIDTIIRKSTDNGLTWGEAQTLVNLPDGASGSAFTIDPSMVKDETTGEIFLLVDMFPESYALVDSSYLENSNGVGSGYREVGGKKYFILRDYESKFAKEVSYTTEYLLDISSGTVYTTSLAETNYTVPNFSNGTLYKNNQAAGNIFLYTGSNAGELKVIKTSYIWLLSSKNNGVTWSDPVDITGQVKENWMRFFGTGPGVGIQIKNGSHAGRLVFPVYHTNDNIGGSQCSAVIYSDDHGKTWVRGESPNVTNGNNPETMNNSGGMLTESQVVEVGSSGHLKIFCRNYGSQVTIGTSDDGGATWTKVEKDANLFDPYCQMTVIRYPQLVENKEAYIFANPAASGRNDGTVRIGFYHKDTDSFEWKYKQLFHEGKYQYSCLTTLPNNMIGILYEGDAPNIKFTSFSIDWITALRETDMLPPKIENIQLEKDEQTNQLVFTVDFDQYIIKTGLPVLYFNINSVKKEAVYLSGNATKQYKFVYPINKEDSGEIIVTNIGSDINSSIGNRNNDMPSDVEFKFDIGSIPEPTLIPTPEPTSTVIPTPEPTQDSKEPSNSEEALPSAPTTAPKSTATPTPTIIPIPSEQIPDEEEKTDTMFLDRIEKQISTLQEGGKVEYIVEESAEITKDILNTLKDKKASLILKADWYSWNLNGKKIKNNISSKTIDFTVSEIEDSELNKILSNAEVKANKQILNIEIMQTEKFGFPAKLKLKLGKKYSEKKVYLCYYNEKKKQIEVVKELSVNKKGKISSNFKKGGKYSITIKKPRTK